MIQDGHTVLREACERLGVDLVGLVEATARWVHPDTFRALPLWYPETARGAQLFNAAYTAKQTNTKRATGLTENKAEGNVQAQKALLAALGIKGSKPGNWTVCHIWGVDDPKNQKTNTIIKDPRYFSCVGNMIWLPTPIKGLTDSLPSIKRMLRCCAFHLYGWACEAEEVRDEADAIRRGELPDHYPASWPTAERKCLPPGTASPSPVTSMAIAKRKAEIRRYLDHPDQHPLYPRDSVREVLAFWGVTV